MLYTIYIYDGTPTRDRRPAAFAGEGVEVEELSFDSDDAAVIYASEKVAEMNGADIMLDDMDSDIGFEYLDSLDIGEGSAVCLAIKREDTFIYGDEDQADMMFNADFDDDYIDDDQDEDDDYEGSPDPEDWDDDADESITEAIVNNPRFNEFAQIKLEISDLEKEISRIKYETASAKEWSFSDKFLNFLSEEDRAEHDRIALEIKDVETEIQTLEKQYKSVQTRWFRTGPYGDDDDFEEVVTILDDNLKSELEPKVDELKARVSELRKDLSVYRKKARDAYNIDAAERRANSGLKDKKDRLDALKASKAEILKEVSESSDFKEVFDFIRSEYKNMEVVEVGISDKGLFAEVKVSYDIEIEDEDFDDEGYLDPEDFEDDVAESICDTLCIGYEGDDDNEPFECEDSDAEFLLELIEVYTSGEPTISRHFTPGRMYMPNGDPGYPDEYDYEVDGDLEGIGLIRVTKIK